MHTLNYSFLQTYVGLSPSGMQYFSFRNLHTFYLPHYVSTDMEKRFSAQFVDFFLKILFLKCAN